MCRNTQMPTFTYSQVNVLIESCTSQAVMVSETRATCTRPKKLLFDQPGAITMSIILNVWQNAEVCMFQSFIYIKFFKNDEKTFMLNVCNSMCCAFLVTQNVFANVWLCTELIFMASVNLTQSVVCNIFASKISSIYITLTTSYFSDYQGQ